MESEHIKSAANKATVKAKEALGKATNDKSLEFEGKAQQAKAKAQKAVGDIKDALD